MAKHQKHLITALENIEPAEARTKRIREIFDKLDADKTGFITTSDIQQRLMELSASVAGPTISRDMAARYAEELVSMAENESHARDKKVDFHEFEKFILGKESKLYELFTSVDTSGDGHINPAELVESLKRVGVRLSGEDLKKFYRAVDRDNSGSIDFEEFRNFCLLLPTAADLTSIFQYYQNVYDPDMFLEITPKPKDGFTLNGFMAGAIAGAASRTVTAPLDRLRVYFQNASSDSGGALARFRIALRNIYAAGGVASFWRGNGLNVLKVAPESAIMFQALEWSKSQVASWEGSKDVKSLSPQGKFLAGSMSGLIAQTITYPLDTLKTRIMSNVATSGKAASSSAAGAKGRSVLVVTVKGMVKEGPSAFYRGIVPASIGVIPYAGINLGVFDTLKSSYLAANPNATDIPTMTILGMGCFSGSVACTAVYPLQVIRTRMQAQGSPSHPYVYRGIGDCIKQSIAREGLKSFYKGLGATLAKAVPSAGITYAVFEEAKKWLNVK
ncbi:hypothetical protein HK102_012813 [Quaeritorhiza haematococci]|nr:hypothetical protein HK102_012813 [Quaeritorhiza haematococci]